ncbi:biosynthetic peptidoglycan transglycosylase [Paraliomyxa miuraensis]|uniref:biosynthetic peptidoglycan transglycosylase n=1 Tax=Paraliomyxa miuraensis TaxID=376150 RepID=UPI00225B7243|nr:biosynthetic peptidoglycan transglycosylase [Paraliomyxa miuraensis]MCX4245816.1 transglycosylase domain-containing protein [Paraliomyxa miuraensis]
MIAGALALCGPALAEGSALQSLRTATARCPAAAGTCGGVAQADVDLGGLRLWHPWREASGFRVEAQEVAITVGLDGVEVTARGLVLDRALTSPKTSATPAATDARPRARSHARPLHTHGVPVHVRVEGSGRWARDGVGLTLGDPELHLDGHGGATASFTMEVEGWGAHAVGPARWTATAVGGDPKRWHATGPVRIDDGEIAQISLDLSREALAVEVRDAAGGRLGVRAPISEPGRRPRSLRIQAEGFSMATLGTLGQRTLDAFGLRLGGARIDATLALDERGDSAGAADVERLRLHGLVIDHPKLAREPVAFDALELSGQLSWDADSVRGTGWATHRDARASLTLEAGPDVVDLHTALDPLSCQSLLDAFPEAMSEMVAGTRLEGALQAHAALHLDRAALTRARRGNEPLLPLEHATLGRLDFSFPFLERCTVVADDPRLDLAALSGPYHHRFVDDRGQARRRVMAPGAPGYVSLSEVPLLARAFVVMEDRRFWRHDGFDREQMEHALWHNLVQGRVSRGASTISQQAARNLWLGVDRSWGRKLQEALLTARLEASTSKARIMELYLNVIELGSGTHGVDEAARLYFGKPASALSVLQSIHLAALAPAPARYAARFEDGRVDDPWRQVLDEHVRRMHRAGFISRAQMLEALRDELQLLDRR